jgi:hypothetical protein
MDRIFFSTMAMLFLGIVLFGFAQTYYLSGIVPLPPWKHGFAGPRPLIVHIHGAVLTAWFLLLVVQTTLISRRHVRLHRRVGYAGMGVAALVVVVGFLVVLEHLARSFPPSDHKIVTGGGSLGTVLDIIVFGVLVGFAYGFRNNPAAHKRLILIGTIGILPPALTRMPAPAFLAGHFQMALVVTYVLVLLIVAYDLISQRRVHPATIGGGLFHVALLNAWTGMLLANSGLWFALAVQAQRLGSSMSSGPF